MLIYTHWMLNVSTWNINIYALAELGMAIIAAEINVSLLLTVYFIFLWRSHFVFTDLKETHTCTVTHTLSLYTHIFLYHWIRSTLSICTKMFCTIDKNSIVKCITYLNFQNFQIHCIGFICLQIIETFENSIIN